MISFSCVYRSSPCLPSNKCYGVTITVMSLSHSWQESLSNLLAFKNVFEHKKVAIFFYILSRRHDYLHVHRKWIHSLYKGLWSFDRFLSLRALIKSAAKPWWQFSVNDFCQRFLWNCKQSGAVSIAVLTTEYSIYF